MGNLAGESWSKLVTRLKRCYVGVDHDPERLKEAVSHYRDALGPKIRPVWGAWGKGRRSGSGGPREWQHYPDPLFSTVFATINSLDWRVWYDLDRNTSAISDLTNCSSTPNRRRGSVGG
jgi:hypothetical protein